jgi:phage shock protein PspC (stress-responsive transcriptional regulator)
MASMNETPDPTPAGSPPPSAPPPPVPPPLPPAAGPRRFLRSREDRLIGGVAGGLGRTFGIDPVLFRIVFVALLFVGGVGVPLYLLTLLVTPSDDGTGRPAAGQSTGRRLVRATALAGLALAALCAAVLAAGLAAWAAAAGGAWFVAAVVIALGLALVAAAYRGGARWLILPALIVALPAGVVSAAEVDLDGGIGERSYRPGSVADVRGGYELGVGELRIDLRRLDWQDGQRVDLPIDLGVGHAIVLVPEEVCVVGRGDVGVGAVNVFGRDTGGVDTEWDEADAGTGNNPRLVVDATIGVGALEVRHRMSPRLDGPGRDWDDDGAGAIELSRERDAAEAACAGVPA